MQISISHQLLSGSSESISLLKKRLASSLTDQNKKIIFIATAALSLLAAGLIIIHLFCMKLKSSSHKASGNEKLIDNSGDGIIKLASKLPKEFSIASKLTTLYANVGDKEGKNSISDTFVLNDSTSIKVVMEREIKGKTTYDTADVNITPENEQVMQEVAAWFKGKGDIALHPTPPKWDWEIIPCNKVTINGKELTLPQT